MKITAFYKVFDGGEWLEASIRSIYDHVDNIVVYNSNISWTGLGTNNCRNIVKNMARTWSKLELVDFNCQHQMTQYLNGFKYIKLKYKPDWILLIDADEIWTPYDWTKAKVYLNKHSEYSTFVCRTHLYLKSAYYRVEPPEELEPVVFVKGTLNEWGQEIRCCDVEPKFHMKDVYIHHFSYVRHDFNSILIKFLNSHTSEKQITEPMDYWIDKWNKLPSGCLLHPAMGFQHVWNHVDIINHEELPQVFRDGINYKIIVKSGGVNRLELPEALLNQSDKELLFDFSEVGLAVELGTFKGAAAIIMASLAHRVFTFDSYGTTPNCEEKKYSYVENVKTLGKYRNINVIQSVSWEAANNFDDGSIELLFIDACHMYEEIMEDAKAFLPKMKPGGFMLFHDHNDKHPNVTRAVRDFENWNNTVVFHPVSNKYYQNKEPSSIKVLRRK